MLRFFCLFAAVYSLAGAQNQFSGGSFGVPNGANSNAAFGGVLSPQVTFAPPRVRQTTTPGLIPSRCCMTENMNKIYECGFRGVTEAVCKGLGCCFNPNLGTKCFRPATDCGTTTTTTPATTRPSITRPTRTTPKATGPEICEDKAPFCERLQKFCNDTKKQFDIVRNSCQVSCGSCKKGEVLNANKNKVVVDRDDSPLANRGDVSSTQFPMTECADEYKTCNRAFIIPLCRHPNYTAELKTYCRKTCNLCECQDKANYCQRFARLCSDPLYLEDMKLCPVTCNTCDLYGPNFVPKDLAPTASTNSQLTRNPSVLGGGFPPGGIYGGFGGFGYPYPIVPGAFPATGDFSGDCADESSGCIYNAQYCQPFPSNPYFTQMNERCKRTCGRCVPPFLQGGAQDRAAPPFPSFLNAPTPAPTTTTTTPIPITLRTPIPGICMDLYDFCANNDESCGQTVQGLDFETACPYTCRLCPPPPIGVCIDLYTACPQHKDKCTGNELSGEFRQVCPITCNICKKEAEPENFFVTTTQSTTTSTTTLPYEIECYDLDACALIPKDRCQEDKKNMDLLCPILCGVCPPDQPFNGTCVDDVSCEGILTALCTDARNKQNMKYLCPAKCGYCTEGPRSSTEEICSGDSFKCEYCSNHRMAVKMSVTCAKECAACKEATTTPPTTTTTTTPTDASPGECRDLFPENCPRIKDLCYMKLSKQRCPATCNECDNYWPPEIPIPTITTPVTTTTSFQPQENIIPKSGTCEDTNKSNCGWIKERGLCANKKISENCMATCKRCSDAPVAKASSVTTTPATATTTTTTSTTEVPTGNEGLEDIYSKNDCLRVKKAQFCDNPNFGDNCKKTCKDLDVADNLPCKDDMDDCAKFADSCKISPIVQTACKRTCKVCAVITTPSPPITPPDNCKDEMPLCEINKARCNAPDNDNFLTVCKKTCGLCGARDTDTVTRSLITVPPPPTASMATKQPEPTTTTDPFCSDAYRECKNAIKLDKCGLEAVKLYCPITCDACDYVPQMVYEEEVITEPPTTTTTTTTTAVPTTPFICEDINPMCGQALSFGLCSQDAIKQGCPQTCSSCDYARTKAIETQLNAGNIDESCKDVSLDLCPSAIGLGFCSNPEIRQGCMVTCGVCEPTTTAAPTTTTTTTTTRITSPPLRMIDVKALLTIEGEPLEPETTMPPPPPTTTTTAQPTTFAQAEDKIIVDENKCEDIIPDCGLAKGMCNLAQIAASCPATCKLCDENMVKPPPPATTTTPTTTTTTAPPTTQSTQSASTMPPADGAEAECKDISDTCNMAGDFCDNVQIAEACPATCNLCGKQEQSSVSQPTMTTSTKATTTTTQVPTTTTAIPTTKTMMATEEPCNDYMNCTDIQQYCNVAQHSDNVRKYCKKSCGVCTDIPMRSVTAPTVKPIVTTMPVVEVSTQEEAVDTTPQEEASSPSPVLSSEVETENEEDCEDKMPQCVEATQELCNDPQYKTYLEENCRKSCNKCPNKKSVAPVVTTTPTTTTTTTTQATTITTTKAATTTTLLPPVTTKKVMLPNPNKNYNCKQPYQCNGLKRNKCSTQAIQVLCRKLCHAQCQPYQPVVSTTVLPFTISTTPMPQVAGAVYYWGEWSECSEECGGGTQTRSGKCDRPGCYMIEESVECNTQPCVTYATPPPTVDRTFSPWSSCSVTCGEGVSTRLATCLKSENSPCKPEVQEVQCRAPPCDVSNNIPVQPNRSPMSSSNNNMMTSADPNNEYIFGEWGPCSVVCGVGEQTRLASCVKKPNCVNTWSGECAQGVAYCNDPALGTRMRQQCPETCQMCWQEGCTDMVETRRCFSGLCPSRQNKVPRYTYTDWSICSKSCGTGFTTRTRECLSSDCQTIKEQMKCNTEPCPIPYRNKCVDVEACSQLSQNLCATEDMKELCPQKCGIPCSGNSAPAAAPTQPPPPNTETPKVVIVNVRRPVLVGRPRNFP